MRSYRNKFHRPVEGLEPDAVGELDLDADVETTLVSLGRLEIVPQEYEVVGSHVVLSTAPGMTVTCALSQAQEASLVGAGHLAVKPAVKPRRKADRGE